MKTDTKYLLSIKGENEQIRGLIIYVMYVGFRQMVILVRGGSEEFADE